MTARALPLPLPLGQIHAPGRLRALREGQVAALAESLAEIGLLQPISVIDATVGDLGEPVYHVVTGAHRVWAARRLGWTEIAAVVVARDHLINRLMEIDENLIRAELSELETAEHLAERTAIHEALHPETRRGVAGGKVQPLNEITTDNLSVRSFAADTADKTNVTDRDIRRAVRRAEKIAPAARDAIRESGMAHRGVDLDALTRLSPAAQVAAVERVIAGTAKDLRAAARLEKPGAPEDSRAQAPEVEDPALYERALAEKTLAVLKRGWTAHQQALLDATPETRGRFLAWLGETQPELAAAIGRDGMPAFLVRPAVPHIPLPRRASAPRIILGSSPRTKGVRG